MKTINGQDFKRLFLSGANNLYNHYPEVDQLNVFPVPDGDTGMNMNLTLTSGAKEIQNKAETSIEIIASSLATALVMGARGNSGTITCQIFRGFADGVKGKNQISVRELAAAFERGREVAYKAVMRPVEGTILTVIREASAALKEYVKNGDHSVEDALDFFLKEAKKSLNHTPELLPILKEVGVVDSGGAGLCIVIEGMAKAAHGNFVERNSQDDFEDGPSSVLAPTSYAGAQVSEDEEGFGYCTQFLLRLGTPEDGKRPFFEKRFRNFLNSHGKSVVMIHDQDIVKVHVHTLNPGTMLNYAQNYGEFLSIVIENMSEEHRNIENGLKATDIEGNLELSRRHKLIDEEKKEEEDNTPLQKLAFIAVSSGEGLDEMFLELGASTLVSGGQTMNPSVEDFVKAIARCHAENVYILPNNSNIVMAASQACDLNQNDKTRARVIPSKTLLQGLEAAMQFAPDGDPEAIYNEMKGALKSVKSGSVTYAIKDTDIDGVHITKDYYIGMRDDKSIVSCQKNKAETLFELVHAMVDDDSYLLTVICGQDIEDAELETLSQKLENDFPNLEIALRKGNQPVYSFLVGVE